MGVPAQAMAAAGYANSPMPRMTNTFVLGGNADRKGVRSIKARHLGSRFRRRRIASTAVRVPGTRPHGREQQVGAGEERHADRSRPDRDEFHLDDRNDFAMDDGVGTCGKSGQSVPVGVGHPSIKIDSITVGGAGI
jgi:TldD protein